VARSNPGKRNVGQRNIRRLSAAKLLVAIALLLTGCASRDAFDRSVEVTTAALISAADPDSLAAAALLGGWGKTTTAKSLALASRAAQQAPERPDLTWLHLQFCARVKACDLEPIEAHMRSLDPANGLVWIGPLTDRAAPENAEQVRATLLAVANSERFDVYWNQIVTHTANAIVKTGKMDASTALVAAMGMAAAETPAYWYVIKACKGQSLQQNETLVECRRAAAVLRRSDTFLAELIGTAIARRVWPEGSPEFRDAVQARRTAHYRMATAIEVTTRAPCDDEFADRYLGWLRTYQTEQQVVLAEIVNAGIDPNPKEDWKDLLESP
jgi:hypothetical protein